MTSLLPTRRPGAARPGRRPRTLDALYVGVAGFLLSAAFAWVPSLWYDEAATVVSSTRSWPELWRMLGNVDAVHGLFYAGMHLWFDLVGYSPLTLRLPSAVATGVAAALTVVLVRQLGNRRLAVLAGVLFCLLPRVTWMGEEGRSFAVTAALAVLLTLVFLAAGRRGDAPVHVRVLWWTLYGVLAFLGTVLFLYLALLVAAHGVTALWARYGPTPAVAGSDARGPGPGWARPGPMLAGWFLSAAAAALLLLPFVARVVAQVGQVGWIDPISWGTLTSVFVGQWFYFNPVFAMLGWPLIGVGILLLVRDAHRRRRGDRPRSGAVPAVPGLLAVVLPWLVVPTVGLVVASVLVSPLYSPRYLAYGAPAAAILMAVALHALPRRRLAVIAVALCAVLAAPQYVAQRLPEAKQESSWSAVADLVAGERALEPAGTSDAIVYGPVRRHPSATTRVIAYAYPDAFAGLIDLKLHTPAAQTGELWETRYALHSVTDRFAGVDVVWLVTSDKQDWRPSVTATLAGLGYRLEREWGLTGVNVLRYVK